MTEAPYIVGTEEYVRVKVTELTGAEIGIGGSVSILLAGQEHPAVWEGDAGAIQTARTADPVDFAGWSPGLYSRFVRFTDSPETPLLDAGPIRVDPAT